MTIRNVDFRLERGIEDLRRRRNWSINQAALYLMRKGLGLSDEAEPVLIGDRLDRFAGVWGDEEGGLFDGVIEETFGRVDEEDWV